MIPRMSFGAKGIEPADGFAGDGFVVRPLVPSDVVLDHEAVMSSREFLYHWEQDPPYPPDDFSVEDNLEDLQQMDSEHRNRTRYTYTVMNADETQVLGCIYILPNDDRMYRTAKVASHDGTDLSSVDATVAFWVRGSTWENGFERTLLEAVLRLRLTPETSGEAGRGARPVRPIALRPRRALGTAEQRPSAER